MAAILKFNADSAKVAQDFDGNITLTLLSSPESRWAVKNAARQLLGKKVTISISEYKNSRSLAQNRMLWALLECLGRAQGQSAWDCYCEMLEAANAKYEYIECIKEAVPTLQEVFRCVKVIEERKGGKTALCKVFYGSSKMDTAEMKNLIDAIFDRLASIGIDVQDESEVAYLWQEWNQY